MRWIKRRSARSDNGSASSTDNLDAPAAGSSTSATTTPAEQPQQPTESKPPAKAQQSGVTTTYNNYGRQLTEAEINAGRHRKRVGGHWDHIGELQFNFLCAQGLRPEHRLLDVGCGALRGGVHFVRYLDAGNYYGIDLNDSLLRAGLETEIPNAGLTDKLPAENLQQTETFSGDGFGVDFDFLVSVSVFSHLPLNHIRLCLAQLAKATKPGARYYTTFFLAGPDLPLDESIKQLDGNGPRTFSYRDPFHYRLEDMEWAASDGDWKFNYIGDWNHTRGQVMAEFVRQ